MRLFALGFVVGAWWLQQQARLPSAQQLLAVCLLISASGFVLHKLLFSHHAASRYTHHFWAANAVKYGLIGLLAALAGASWATWCAQMRLSDALPSAWEQKNMTIIGVVASVPEVTERGARFNFRVERVLSPASPVSVIVPANISLNVYADEARDTFEGAHRVKSYVSPFHAGERWQFTVRLKRPHSTYNPHGFDMEAWALSEGVRATGSVRNKSGFKKLDDLVWRPSYLVNRVRENIGANIAQVLADKPYAGVIRALVIGDDSQISAQDWQLYLRTGTNHLMSISGLHITMLSGLMFALVYWAWRQFPLWLLRLPARKAASLAGMLTAITYAALAGFSVPTQRTLYMLMVVSFWMLTGRRLAFSRVLSIALLVVVLLDPWAVIAPGFWLSFGAIAVIAFAVGARMSQPHWLWAAVKVQWAVTLGLVPALLLMFGQTSIASPIANAFAIPLVSFVVVPLSLLGSVLPSESLLNTSALLHVAHAALAYGMQALDGLAAMPWATWQQAAPSVPSVVLAMAGVVWLLMPSGVPLRALGVLWMLPMFFSAVPRPTEGSLSVTVLDVGQGLSVVVQTATHTMLYDAGSRYSLQSDAGGRIVVPYLRGQGMAALDGAVVSHDDIDHAGGMPSVLAQLPVEWLVSSLGEEAELFNTPAWQPHLPQERMRCYAGQFWHWDGVKFEVLSPSLEAYEDSALKDNDKSCVIKITSPFGRVLLTGDIEKVAENALLTQGIDLQSEVMIAPHHGSKTSSSVAFLQAVKPSHVVITNGYLNRFGHPKPMIEQRYLAMGAQVHRSDYDGAIKFTLAQGHSPRVMHWRKAHPKYWHDHYSRTIHE